MTGSLTGVANAAPVNHLTTQTATATGAGATGTPSIATFNIPSGKNRVLFIWATFERDHCSDADVAAANRCVNGNTAGTGLGDNYPEPRIGTAPATTSNNQLTARIAGPGGTINKQNALVIGGTPSGDTRFIRISTSPSGSPAGTAYFSVDSFHIVLFENEINTLLGGAASGTVTITLPDTVAPSNAGDDALLIASVFQNVEQTVNGFVRNATATAQVVAGTPGNSILAPAAYDAGQVPDEADDGKLVMGANSSTEGFLTPAGHVALATLSVTNAGGNFDTPSGNSNNEPNGFTGGAYFRNGGATPGSLYSLQMAGAASTLVYGATNASFLLESDNADTSDAPISYGSPTHTIVNGIRLGASVDADPSLLSSSNATGDDTNGTDDEDGVTIPSLIQGQSATISVAVNQITAGTGRLQGWIDWNGDGDFADAGEQIATNLQFSTGTSGTISVPVTVPANAITSAPTFARFRWSTTASLSSTATAIDGEVEDYQVAIAPTYSLSGNIFDDLDGSKVKAVSGENYTAANITAVLLDASNKVVSTAAVNATGDYTLNNVPAGTYSIKIIQTPATTLTTGAVIPPANDILPTNWVATGENNNGTPDATVDRTQTVTVAAANIANINFGIEQLPDTTALTPPSQSNPGGTATVPVTTLAGTDPEDGALGSGKTFKIVTLPTNADLYYNGTKITTPNFIIANYDPTKLTVDPNDGTVTVSFTYAAVDAAGQQDSTPATVTMPFTSSSSPANLLLIKRITAINGANLNVYKDDTDNTTLHAADDNNVNWPTPLNTNTAFGDTTISTFLRGAIDGGKVKPGDTIEYTIYFLNAGGSNATNVRVCDRITGEQKFLSGSTIQLQQNNATPTALTSSPDADRATFYASSSDPAITNCNFTSTPTLDNGAIMVDVTGAAGSPTWTTLPGSTGPGTANTYGMVRFTTKVNP